MDWREKYYMRKAHGLCVRCGDPADDGKTRCKICARIEALKSRGYYHKMDENKKSKKTMQIKEWLANNPDRVEIYKLRKAEYNRRYNNSL